MIIEHKLICTLKTMHESTFSSSKIYVIDVKLNSHFHELTKERLKKFILKILGQTDDKNVYNTTSCIEKPYRCPHPKIKFFLYTRRTQENGEELNVLDSESLWNSHWNPNHPVKIIIHGKFQIY